MNSSGFIEQLRDNNINVHQIDDLLTQEMKEMHSFFSTVKKDARSKKVALKKRFNKKIKDLDDVMSDVDSYVKSIDKLLTDPKANSIDTNELNMRLIQVSENMWTAEDKKEFNSAYNSYLENTVYGDIRIKLTGVFLRNRMVKLLVHSLIFIASFLGSSFLEALLELPLIELEDIYQKLIASFVIFIVLESLLNVVKYYTLNWRVFKLFKSIVFLRPKIKELANLIEKKDKIKLE